MTIKSIIPLAIKVVFLIVIARVCIYYIRIYACMGLELITRKVVVCVFPEEVL